MVIPLKNTFKCSIRTIPKHQVLISQPLAKATLPCILFALELVCLGEYAITLRCLIWKHTFSRLYFLLLRNYRFTILNEAVTLFVLLLQEYSTKQLTSLVNCGTGSHFSKKAKQRLLVVIEETEKSRTRWHIHRRECKSRWRNSRSILWPRGDFHVKVDLGTFLRISIILDFYMHMFYYLWRPLIFIYLLATRRPYQNLKNSRNLKLFWKVL